MLILASKSPRRQEILREAGIPFGVRTAFVPEVRKDEETPEEYVQRLAGEKAAAVIAAKGEVILAADTVVVLDGEVLEKPEGEEDAARMLRLLSGRRHSVLTGICLKHAEGQIVDYSRTYVTFAELDEDEIRVYSASGEPMDKAGAYAIQGMASKFVERVEGCYFNVVGLPVSLVYRWLKSIKGSGG